jgi:hypothetical protein
MKLYASYKVAAHHNINVFECTELSLPVYKIFYNDVLVAVRCHREAANTKALDYVNRLAAQFKKVGAK